ncbi:TIGR00725 family protein [Desertifilum sp. FACHB-1129]|uniref:TIGR00725 family protein n=1 Tax=Desertifilum tharense IPPAS B-1220 TaxID=1781255 RepID=A0A1E5QDU2_9CYAN|nr:MULTISPECIES: TIGR00725 family protein [Desertifilum]MDA0209051.1 TIGR00725 family protein [Cyanobacteria bacterium FC1]MBD2310533.1 TIGR00725 family protein [Desertifilum sp. FACHB-1129]MBD2321985.1 TIGR00725 family protein [Desertifilum sp. FACHB-866]MBD2332112.1 TIGR00725 family protein [Desertifilum sp. FACHB-868]OEJ72840.1 TIGR00725 family protein [Desertifilum tharense IPPAS B-1220]
MPKIIIGVMGPGKGATPQDLENAWELGKQIAQQGWVLLTGGRNVGVMDAASRGAKSKQGLTIGILPNGDRASVSEAVDIAIVTDLGNARNNINILSCDGIVACGMGAGTASEVALAIKSQKRVILLGCDRETQVFFSKLAPTGIQVVETVESAIALLQQWVSV